MLAIGLSGQEQSNTGNDTQLDDTHIDRRRARCGPFRAAQSTGGLAGLGSRGRGRRRKRNHQQSDRDQTNCGGALLHMPLVSGMEATRQIRDRLRQTEVIFTIHEDERHIAEMLDAGARGYVLKSDNTEQLLDAIASLAEHKPFFTTIVSEALLRAFLTRQRREGIRLSDWERTLVQLIIEGRTNRQVANILKLRHKTLESRRMAIMRKLNLSSASALVRYAIRNGLVEP